MSETIERPRPAGFGGEVLRSGDPEYDDARAVFNAMVDKRPAMIARCESAADVQAALRYGVTRELEIAVRGGGHGVAGTAVTDGGVVLDLRRMNGVRIDPETRLASVGGGATWADFDRACRPYGLATTGGRVSTTGVAGLTLGGGSGWFERKWGLACDALVSVELVTADGRLLLADERKHPELFWALHGGGGNFGVATSLTFELQELGTTTLALLFWPAEAGPAVLRAYRDLIEQGAPEDLGGGVLLRTGPPKEFVPVRLQGEPCVVAAAVFAGMEGELREVFAPMFGLAPEGELVAQMPYDELQRVLDDPPGFRNYWSAEHLMSLPDAAIEVFCDRAADRVAPSKQALLPWGGEVLRAADKWPLPHRQALWVAHPFGMWTDPADDARGIRWVRGVCDDLREWATGYVYLNFIGYEGQNRVIAGFGEDNYKRLARVKCEYDPENVFHLNQNIEPGWPC